MVEVLKKKYANCVTVDFPCYEPFETRDILASHISKYNDYNTVISTLNTKVSALAVCMLAIDDESVQLCYAPANRYNYEGYSETSDECELYKVTF
jgi:hypothetical protein